MTACNGRVFSSEELHAGSLTCTAQCKLLALLVRYSVPIEPCMFVSLLRHSHSTCFAVTARTYCLEYQAQAQVKRSDCLFTRCYRLMSQVSPP